MPYIRDNEDYYINCGLSPKEAARWAALDDQVVDKWVGYQKKKVENMSDIELLEKWEKDNT